MKFDWKPESKARYFKKQRQQLKRQDMKIS